MEKQIYLQDIGEYLVPFARTFRRSEARDLAQCYAVGLIMDGERKSVEPMSERVQGSDSPNTFTGLPVEADSSIARAIS